MISFDRTYLLKRFIVRTIPERIPDYLFPSKALAETFSLLHLNRFENLRISLAVTLEPEKRCRNRSLSFEYISIINLLRDGDFANIWNLHSMETIKLLWCDLFSNSANFYKLVSNTRAFLPYGSEHYRSCAEQRRQKFEIGDLLILLINWTPS